MLQDFYRGGRNCSYFAVSPIEVTQRKLIGLLEELRLWALSQGEPAIPPDPAAPSADVISGRDCNHRT